MELAHVVCIYPTMRLGLKSRFLVDEHM